MLADLSITTACGGSDGGAGTLEFRASWVSGLFGLAYFRLAETSLVS